MLIPKKSITTVFLASILFFLSLAVKAEIVEIKGKIDAFFPRGEYYIVKSTERVTHMAHANKKDMIFYDIYLVEGHGDEPSKQWVRNFVKGQEASVVSGAANIINITTQDFNITGSFALSGRYEGMQYKKMCKLILNPDDYATWCVSVLSKNANTIKAWDNFLTYGDSFILRN